MFATTVDVHALLRTKRNFKMIVRNIEASQEADTCFFPNLGSKGQFRIR